MSERRVPEIGAIEGGYRFLGGDPARPESWRALSREGNPSSILRPTGAPPILDVLRRRGVPPDVALRMALAMRRRTGF